MATELFRAMFRPRVALRRATGFHVQLPVQLVLVRPATRLLAYAERYASAHPELLDVQMVATEPGAGACAGRVVVHPAPTEHGAASPESFAVTVGTQIEVTAAGQAGALYAVQEVLSMLEECKGGRIPACTLRDAPAVARRWVYLDCAPSAAFTCEYLFRVIDLLAEFRVNGLVLALHTNFNFKTVPGFGGPDALSPGELKRVTAHARERFMTLVPGIDVSRTGEILALERYRHSSTAGRVAETGHVAALYRAMIEELVAATDARYVSLGNADTAAATTSDSAALVANTQSAVARMKRTPLVYAAADATAHTGEMRAHGPHVGAGTTQQVFLCSIDTGNRELTIPYAQCTRAIMRCVQLARTRHATGCIHFIEGLENGHALPCALPYACYAGACFWSGVARRDTDGVMDAVTARLFGSDHHGWRKAQQAFDREMVALRGLATQANGGGTGTLQFRTQCYYPRDFISNVTSRFACVGLEQVGKLTALIWETERMLAEFNDAATRNTDIAGLLRLPVLFFQFLLCAFEQLGRCEQEYHLAACAKEENAAVSRGHLIRASIAVQRLAEQYGDLLELHHHLWRHCGTPRRDIKLLRAMYHHLTRLATTIERQGKRPYALPAFQDMLCTHFAHDDGHFHDRVPIPADKL
jgi:hypothetical protein